MRLITIPDFEIWVFNEYAQNPDCKRWDVLFQLHKSEIYTSLNNLSNSKHWEWLQQTHGKTIYMIDEDPRVPDSKRLPLEEMQSEIPFMAQRYFELSASYALVYAVLYGYKEIHVYGMDLVSNTEYIYQADCWRAWLMWAWGRGVNIVMHCNEGLFGDHLYGYDGEIALSPSFFESRESFCDASWKAANKHMINCRKAVERAFEQGYKTDEIINLISTYKQASQDAGSEAGRAGEARRFKEFGERPIYRTDFERSAAQRNKDGEQINNKFLMTFGKMEYLFSVWQALKNKESENQLKYFINEMVKLAYDLGAHLGGFQEDMDYIHELDKRIQAAGGRKSIQILSMNAMEQIKA